MGEALLELALESGNLAIPKVAPLVLEVRALCAEFCEPLIRAFNGLVEIPYLLLTVSPELSFAELAGPIVLHCSGLVRVGEWF